jgi:hypothetical protein
MYLKSLPTKPAKHGTSAGKYLDLSQLQEGILYFGAMMQALWPFYF